MSAKEKITKIAEKWYLLEPLFFAVWTLHKVEPSMHIKTIKVHDGHIEYNPLFIEGLSPDELNDVLVFEAMRIVLKHPYRRKKDIPQISYLASNITIQEHLNTTLGFPNSKDIFRTSDFDKKHFEFYYDKITEFTAEGDGSDDDAGGEASDETTEDDDESEGESEGDENGSPSGSDTQNGLSQYTDEKQTGLENATAWDGNDYVEQLINDKIKESQLSNSWGTITGNTQEEILATLKPKVNYRTILKTFRASVLSNSRRLTRMKPSRRYGFLYMGSKRDFTTRLLFAVDTSGSVSSYALSNAFSVLNTFFKYGIEKIDVICFDTEIKGERLTLKKAQKTITISGRGGTDFNAVIEYINEHRSYDGVIIFTDGFASRPKIPKNRKTKILWLFDTERSYKYGKDELSKLGKVAFMKES